MDNVTIAAPTITFNANGGSDTRTSATVGSDGKLTELPQPSWDGHGFAGWYNGDTKVNTDTEYTGDTTLTAHWTDTPAPTTHTVTYKVVNGKWNDNTKDDKHEENSLEFFLFNFIRFIFSSFIILFSFLLSFISSFFSSFLIFFISS